MIPASVRAAITAIRRPRRPRLQIRGSRSAGPPVRCSIAGSGRPSASAALPRSLHRSTTRSSPVRPPTPSASIFSGEALPFASREPSALHISGCISIDRRPHLRRPQIHRRPSISRPSVDRPPPVTASFPSSDDPSASLPRIGPQQPCRRRPLLPVAGSLTVDPPSAHLRRLRQPNTLVRRPSPSSDLIHGRPYFWSPPARPPTTLSPLLCCPRLPSSPFQSDPPLLHRSTVPCEASPAVPSSVPVFPSRAESLHGFQSIRASLLGFSTVPSHGSQS